MPNELERKDALYDIESSIMNHHPSIIMTLEINLEPFTCADSLPTPPEQKGEWNHGQGNKGQQ